MGGLTTTKKKQQLFLVWFSHHEIILKFLVLSLLGDYIKGNTVEKDFQILIKLNFINIYTIVREKDWTKISNRSIY